MAKIRLSNRSRPKPKLCGLLCCDGKLIHQAAVDVFKIGFRFPLISIRMKTNKKRTVGTHALPHGAVFVPALPGIIRGPPGLIFMRAAEVPDAHTGQARNKYEVLTFAQAHRSEFSRGAVRRAGIPYVGQGKRA